RLEDDDVRIVTDQLRADRAGWEPLAERTDPVVYGIVFMKVVGHASPSSAGRPTGARAPEASGRAPGIGIRRKGPTHCWSPTSGSRVHLHRVCGGVRAGEAAVHLRFGRRIRWSGRHRPPTLRASPGARTRRRACTRVGPAGWRQCMECGPERFTYRCVERGPVEQSTRDGRRRDMATGKRPTSLQAVTDLGQTRTTEDERLLSRRPERGAPTDFTHTDPWRVFRIMGEFVEGFDTLATLGPAVSIFGSARILPDGPMYEAALETARRLVEAGFGVITGGGPG